MSSNGLTSSRWAAEDGAVASAPVPVPSAAAQSPTTNSRVGLAASRWAQPEPATRAEEEDEEEEGDDNDDDSVIWIPTDSTDIIFVMSVMLAAIFDLAGHAEVRGEGLSVKELLLADEQLLGELVEYLGGFSPQAREIAYDQLATYVGRSLEDEERYEPGTYARECGLWMERLRQKDLRGEFEDLEVSQWWRTLESIERDI